MASAFRLPQNCPWELPAHSILGTALADKLERRLQNETTCAEGVGHAYPPLVLYAAVPPTHMQNAQNSGQSHPCERHCMDTAQMPAMLAVFFGSQVALPMWRSMA